MLSTIVGSFVHRYCVECYVRRAHALFRPLPRPMWVAYLILIVEYSLIFSLTLSSQFLSDDRSRGFFVNLSLHSLNGSMVITNFLIIAIPAMNIFILISTLIVLGLSTSISLKGQQPLISALSCVLMNFNSVLLIPAILISLKQLTHQWIIGQSIVSRICISSSIIVSILNSLHAGQFAEYTNPDSLAKYGSGWDACKYTFLALAIIALESLGDQVYYPVITTFYCLTNLIDFSFKNVYHSKAISVLFSSLNILLLSFSAINGLTIKNILTNSSTAIAFFTIIPLSLKLGSLLTQSVLNQSASVIQIAFISPYNLSARATTKAQAEYLIDYHTRQLLALNINTASKNKSQNNIFSDLFQRVTSFNQFTSSRHPTSLHIGSYIEEQEYLATVSIKEQVAYLEDYFHSDRVSRGNLNDFFMPRSKKKSPTLRSLFYSLEVEQNLPKLAIQLSKFTANSSNSLFDQSLAYLITYRMKDVEQKQREQSSQAGLLYQTTSGNLKPFTATATADFCLAFSFNENIGFISHAISKTLQLKISFLSDISQDCIDLTKVESKGSLLIRSIREIAVKLKKLQLSINGQQLHSQELQHISIIFLQSLWLDPRDYNFQLVSKGLGQVGEGSTSDYKDSHLFNEELNLYSHTASAATEAFAESNKQCIIEVSLTGQNIGIISKASETCLDFTGFSVPELVGQNISILQSPAIAVTHNSIIRRGIEDGVNRIHNQDSMPIVMKNKAGFGVRIYLEFQLHVGERSSSTQNLKSSSSSSSSTNLVAASSKATNSSRFNSEHETIISLVAKVSDSQSEERFLLIDVNLSNCSGFFPRVDVASSRLFAQIFSPVGFKFPSEIANIDAKQIIPVLSTLVNYLKETSQKDFLKLTTLAFIPSYKKEKQQRTAYSKKRLRDNQSPIIQCFRRGFFNYQCNSVYQIEVDITHYKKQGEFSLLYVSFNKLTKLRSQQNIYDSVVDLLLPQLIEFSAVSPDDSQFIIDSILSSSDDTARNSTKSSVWKKHTRFSEVDTKSFTATNTVLSPHNSQVIVGSCAPQQQQLQQPLSVTKSNLQSSSPTLDTQAMLVSVKLIEIQQQQLPSSQSASIEMIEAFENQMMPLSTRSVSQFSPRTQLLSNDPIKESQFPVRNKQPFTEKQLGTKQFQQTSLFLRSKSQEDDRNTPPNNNDRTKSSNSNHKSQKLHPDNITTIEQHDSINERPLNPLPAATYSTFPINHPAKKIFKQGDSDSQKQYFPHVHSDLREAIAIPTAAAAAAASYLPRDSSKKLTRQQKRKNTDNIETSISTSTGQKSASSFHRFFNPRQSNKQTLPFTYIALTFLVDIIVMAFSYSDLKQAISSSRIQSSFQWWQNEVNIEILMIVKLNAVRGLIEIAKTQGIVTPEMQSYQTTIKDQIEYSYSQLLKEFASLQSQSSDELRLTELLQTQHMQFNFFVNQNVYKSQLMSIYSVLLRVGYNGMQIAQVGLDQHQLIELQFFDNYPTIMTMLSTLKAEQTATQDIVLESINSTAVRALYIIFCVTTLIPIIIIPYYVKVQCRKEFVLRLFASISPNSIQKMHSNALQSLQDIIAAQHQKLKTINLREKLFRQREQGSDDCIALESVKEPRLSQQVQGGQKPNQYGHKLAVLDAFHSMNLPRFTTKKRQNMPTTSLIKYNYQVIIKMVLSIITVSLQPFVNTLLISQSITTSVSERTIVSAMYKLLESQLTEEYAIFSRSHKALFEGSSFINTSALDSFVKTSIAHLPKQLSKFVPQMQAFSTSSQALNTQMNVIFTKNVCIVLSSANPSLFSGETFSLSNCVRVYNGVLEQGYIAAIENFSTEMGYYSEIISASTATTSAEISAKHKQFFQVNEPVEVEYFVKIMQITTNFIINSIIAQKQLFYESLELTQLFFFIFEISFIVVIVYSSVYPFFVIVQEQITTIIHILAVLQLREILENPYITSFLTHSNKTNQ